MCVCACICIYIMYIYKHLVPFLVENGISWLILISSSSSTCLLCCWSLMTCWMVSAIHRLSRGLRSVSPPSPLLVFTAFLHSTCASGAISSSLPGNCCGSTSRTSTWSKKLCTVSYSVCISATYILLFALQNHDHNIQMKWFAQLARLSSGACSNGLERGFRAKTDVSYTRVNVCEPFPSIFPWSATVSQNGTKAP